MNRRNAFTLTELMVAIGIIVVIAALGLLVVAGRSSSQKIGDGTELLQGKMLTARTKAFSEQTPRGIRLIAGADGFVHRLIYIEQAPPLPLPGEYGGDANVFQTQAQLGTPQYTVYLTTLDITGGFGAADQWRVQAGDAIAFNGSQQAPQFGPYTIVQTPTPNTGGGGTLVIYVAPNQAPPFPAPANPVTSNFWIRRANRPLAGEEPMDLPDGVGIDLIDTMPVPPDANGQPKRLQCSVIVPDRYVFSASAMTSLANVLPPGDMQKIDQVAGATFTPGDLQYVLTSLGINQNEWPTIMLYTGLIDILFAPNGSVLASAPNGSVTEYPLGKIILWVCDLTGAQSAAPSPLAPPGTVAAANNYLANARLIVIYTRTGFIAGHAVDRSPDGNGNYLHPFSFTQDGQPGGL